MVAVVLGNYSEKNVTQVVVEVVVAVVEKWVLNNWLLQELQ